MAKELSKGMTQKLSMLLALLIQPQALLVDEPMVGLDPASIEDVLKIFTLLKEEGCAVFVSTHIIDIIKDIYDEAYIMIRMNEGTPGNIEGGELTHITGNLYLLRAKEKSVKIEIR